MNLLQACQGGVSRPLVRRLLPVLVVLVPSAVAGTFVLARVSSSMWLLLLGLLITLYALVALGRLRLVVFPAHERWVGVLAGLCSGVIGGATSIFAPPVVLYLTALDLPKEAFVATTALCLLVGQIPQLVSLVSLQVLTVPRLGMAALFCGLSACGFVLGVRVRRRISQQRFVKVVLVTLLLSFMRQRACGGGFPGLLQHRAVDGRPDFDSAGAAGNRGGQHEDLGVHARLLGEVTSAEPDVVPAHRLHRFNFSPVPGVRLLLKQLPFTVIGIPGNFAPGVHGIPRAKKSKVYARPSCVAWRSDPTADRLALGAKGVNARIWYRVVFQMR